MGHYVSLQPATGVKTDGQPLPMNETAICGKGGSGKSSVVALLANDLQSRGCQVLVVDSDESNPGLCRMLGFEKRPEPLLELIGGKRKVLDAFSESSQLQESVLLQKQIRTKDLPSQYLVERGRIRMVCIGKILQSLEGCACPMGVLSREFLTRLAPEEEEMVLVDMEAGIEHFGRGIETSLDSVLVVTEPSFDSLELTERINALAAEVQMKGIWTILNKVRSKEMALELTDQLEKGHIRGRFHPLRSSGVPVGLARLTNPWQQGARGRWKDTGSVALGGDCVSCYGLR
jgi:CO dehydrogenase maturation factor